MKIKPLDIISWTLIALALAAAVIIYPSLPEQIPMHWNVEGTVDSYGARISIYFLPVLMLGINAMLWVLPILDPKRKNFEKFSPTMSVIRFSMSALLTALFTVTIIESLAPGTVNVSSLVTMLIGFLLIVLGNYLPKVKHNYFVGVRSPWTLASEEVWTRTHRFSGPVFMLGGVILSISSVAFASAGPILFTIMMCVVVLVSLVPFGYSYWLFRSLGS